MSKLLNLFDFNYVTSGVVLLERFGLMLLLSLVVVLISAFIIINVRKRKFTEQVGFSNLFKQCFMWAILLAMAFVGIILFLMIRFNGTYFFSNDALDWSLYCGWVLIIPELVLLLMGVIVFFILDNSINKSINN